MTYRWEMGSSHDIQVRFIRCTGKVYMTYRYGSHDIQVRFT